MYIKNIHIVYMHAHTHRNVEKKQLIPSTTLQLHNAAL